MNTISRRTFLKAGSASVLGAASLISIVNQPAKDQPTPPAHADHSAGHGGNLMVGDVDPNNINHFDPTAMLTDWDYGKVSQLPNGQTLREYEIFAGDKEIEIAPGVMFSAWTYNGRVPGPTLRCTEGDHIRIHFTNGSSHPHSMHFHGIHSGAMDGIEPVAVGGTFTYEFDAEPFGLHLYHCHVLPLKHHIHKGLYGGFIIDPKQGRLPAHELFMMMNGFDTDFDNENDVYAVNTVGFHFQRHPIQIKLNELVRVYLVNILEFDLINGFHLHANFFDVYRTGTRLTTNEYT
ncbi:MAG TPA: multicopper oxidase domain-containing protein, partial [Anaerolineae bacterium]|nr:multicopper oxidase domain-containing protein [Anaerolineae bacterium]